MYIQDWLFEYYETRKESNNRFNMSFLSPIAQDSMYKSRTSTFKVHENENNIFLIIKISSVERLHMIYMKLY